jgi:glyoxylase-like metal-dependent hydrolase (beta-lactamase superfamily II)
MEVARDLFCLPLRLVNVCLIGAPGGEWVLVDAGFAFTAAQVADAAAARFGTGARPTAIILTHGHFDHVGGARVLADRWEVPLYAHPLEMPYLTGQADYLPPDPMVGGGMVARLSSLMPNEGVDLGARVRPLPEDGGVPGAPGWRWVHTPGHTPGHVALFRDSDRVLLAGDAFTTIAQESAVAVLLQTPEVHGPPAYFTPDWPGARESVRRLKTLHPSLVVAGHGPPMGGEALAEQLELLARDFDQMAVPERGRYVPPELYP